MSDFCRKHKTMSNPEDNPFTALFSNPASNSAKMNTLNNATIPSSVNDSTEILKIDSMVKKVFYITIDSNATTDPKKKNQLVYLEELSNAVSPQKKIDLDILEQALFERLLLPGPLSCVIPKHCKEYDKNVVQKEVITYLFLAEQNLLMYTNIKDDCEVNAVKRMRELIMRNAVTALKQPELFDEQNLSEQLLNLMKDYDISCHNFIYDIVKGVMSDGNYYFDKIQVAIYFDKFYLYFIFY